MTPAVIKTILCYGDSNTWGNVPGTDDRHPRDVRWPGALQNLLGEGYEIISEGLCGRTLVAEDPAKPHRTGITHLQAILESADPIDGMVVMLGTNDLKSTYGLTPAQLAGHLLQTIELVRNAKDLEKIPEILIVCPPPIVEPEGTDLDPRLAPGLDAFKVLPSLYEEVARQQDCGFIDAGAHVSSSKVDGYHLDADAHLKLAGVIGGWVAASVRI